MGTEMQRWADDAMYAATPMSKDKDTDLVVPKVHLLWMTPDPLGAIAAMCRMYEGKPTYSLTSIADEDRRNYWKQATSTHLKAPLEAVKLHFFIEGVDRAFTHQMVRQRTAVYAQESLRFAVKENLASEVVVPPHIVNDENASMMFKVAMEDIEHAYNSLINAGIPAEDARAILPHAVATRLNYVTDLRSLADHAGNRLCTQAQFHWRLVFAQIVNAIRNYGHQRIEEDWSIQTGEMMSAIPIRPGDEHYDKLYSHFSMWQFETMADSLMFRPVCFHLNRCPFKADFDRHCNIRSKVDEFAAHGIDSSMWEYPHEDSNMNTVIHGIKPEEWLANPDAAIKRS